MEQPIKHKPLLLCSLWVAKSLFQIGQYLCSAPWLLVPLQSAPDVFLQKYYCKLFRRDKNTIRVLLWWLLFSKWERCQSDDKGDDESILSAGAGVTQSGLRVMLEGSTATYQTEDVSNLSASPILSLKVSDSQIIGFLQRVQRRILIMPRAALAITPCTPITMLNTQTNSCL